MRISDWSSDVCSSDLPEQLGGLLTQLASDDPDQAIAALTRVAEIDHSTVELHLTLGNLFRKRGEIDRALRIHEALLARTGLSDDVQVQVRRELAYDYLRAGVMDHAEAQFEKLATGGRDRKSTRLNSSH